jgi:hypothetical protein
MASSGSGLQVEDGYRDPGLVGQLGVIIGAAVAMATVTA